MAREQKNRPASHQIGDLAEAQVTKLFTSQGWIVSPAVKDYGEDLVVQICKEGTILPFRLFVQVKGTSGLHRFERKKYFSYGKLSRATIRRWLASLEPIMIVLWDVEAERGVFGFASEIFDEILISEGLSQSVTATIPKSSTMDDASINAIGIQAVLTWAVRASRAAEGTKVHALRENVDKEYADFKFTDTGLWILRTLDAVYIRDDGSGKRWYVNDSFLSSFGRHLAVLLKENLGDKKHSRAELRETVQNTIQQAITLQLVQECYERSGEGLEMSVLNTATEVLYAMIAPYKTDSIVDLIVENGGKM